ncbi:BRO family protein [Paraburkholderia sp. BL8N3]|nr:phage antirepressor KilAC domain-containing protein [Paraburkholderia sp. BL8N3]TCK39673.1 BRO family protein [Paraburkholderia sp. BL8N3]
MSIIPFKFNALTIRLIDGADGEPWFVASDVCAALDIGNTSMALMPLDDDEKGVSSIDTPGGRQEVRTVSESGLYSLVMRSRKPEAKLFKRWITHEVLPSIRKTGAYGVVQIPQNLPDALRLAADLADERDRLKVQVEEAAPKVEALNRLTAADGAMCITDAAKNLQEQPKRLFGWMQSNNWIYRRPGGATWTAYQDKLQRGMLEHKVTTVHRGDGSEKVTTQVLVTAKGLAELAQKFRAGDLH